MRSVLSKVIHQCEPRNYAEDTGLPSVSCVWLLWRN